LTIPQFPHLLFLVFRKDHSISRNRTKITCLQLKTEQYRLENYTILFYNFSGKYNIKHVIACLLSVCSRVRFNGLGLNVFKHAFYDLHQSFQLSCEASDRTNFK